MIGLSGQGDTWSTRAVVDFVLNHVLESQIVGRSNKNLAFDLFSGHTIIQKVIARGMIPVFLQKTSHDCMFGSLVDKGGAVDGYPFVHCHFRKETFNELINGHSARHTVWVDDEIRSYPILGKRHIFFGNKGPNGSLLSAPTGEFVSDFWNSFFANPDFGNTLAFLILRQIDAVHNTRMTFARKDAGIRNLVWTLFLKLNTSNHHHFITEYGADLDEPVFIQLVVIVAWFQVGGWVFGHVGDAFLAVPSQRPGLFVGLIHRIVGGMKKTTFDGRLVNQDRVFDVVSGVSHDGHNRILPVGKRFIVQIAGIS